MIPVDSAIGMKLSGWRMPSRGWFQRSSASAPVISPRDQAQLRLHRQHEFAALDRLAQRRFGVDLAPGARRPARSRTGNIGSPPRSLARYIAMSAARISAFDARAMVGRHRDADRRADVDAVAVKLERLADRQRDPPRDALGIVAACDVRQEDGEFVARQPRQQRARDWPPSPTSALTTTRRRLATMISNWSPRAWPRLSLTRLKRSRSTNSIADRASGSAAREQLVGFGAEMEPVGQRRDRIVHAQRMGIFDRAAHFGEQAVDRGGELGQAVADDARRRAW